MQPLAPYRKREWENVIRKFKRGCGAVAVALIGALAQVGNSPPPMRWR